MTFFLEWGFCFCYKYLIHLFVLSWSSSSLNRGRYSVIRQTSYFPLHTSGLVESVASQEVGNVSFRKIQGPLQRDWSI